MEDKSYEKHLLRLAREGDNDAIDQLLQEHFKSVYNLAYRLTGNYDDAQDVISEAFLRVYNALPRFRGDANFSTWLYRIVMNVFLDERKKRRLRQHDSLEAMVQLDEGEVQRQIEDDSPGPIEAIERGEEAVIVQRAVLALPEAQRTMIALYHFQELSYEEIAAIMKLPIGTVKSRLNRARLALKSKLQGQRELLGR